MHGPDFKMYNSDVQENSWSMRTEMCLGLTPEESSKQFSRYVRELPRTTAFPLKSTVLVAIMIYAKQTNMIITFRPWLEQYGLMLVGALHVGDQKIWSEYRIIKKMPTTFPSKYLKLTIQDVHKIVGYRLFTFVQMG